MKKIFLVFTLILGFLFIQNIASAQGVDDFYLAKLTNKIKNNWLIPCDSEEKNAIVVFTINKDGKVTKANVIRSSGNENFDRSAYMAVYKAVPYEKLPQDASLETLDIQFYFCKSSMKAIRINNEIKENNIEKAILTETKTLENIKTTVTPDNKTANEIALGSYMEYLQKKIKLNWTPPKDKQSKDIIAIFKLDKYGSLKNLNIKKSSGDKIFDEEALNAISKAAPFAPLPQELKDDSMNIEFSFNYNVFGRNNYSYYTNSTLKSSSLSDNSDNSTDSTNSTDYNTYKNQALIVLSYNLPNKIYFKKKYAFLKIIIDKNGKLKYINIEQSSGDKKYDDLLLASLKKSSFPPIPSSLNIEEFPINYTVAVKKDPQLVVENRVSGSTVFASIVNLACSILLIFARH